MLSVGDVVEDMSNASHRPPDSMLLHVMLTVAAIVQGVAFTDIVQSGGFQLLRLGLVMSSDD